MIAKGCACQNGFLFPFDKEQVAKLNITYKEKGVIKVQKELNDCFFEDGKVCVELTQEDTLKFTNNTLIRVQIRGRLKDGTPFKSNIVEDFTDEVLYEGVV